VASEHVERKLTTILASDVVGYSRLTGADEELTLARLRTLRSDLIDPIIAVHRGRVVKRTGDGSILEFHRYSADACIWFGLGQKHRDSNVRGWSGYPSKLSVKADIPDGPPSANCGHSAIQQWRLGSWLSRPACGNFPSTPPIRWAVAAGARCPRFLEG
jgi:class 3 adenylate cyclase